MRLCDEYVARLGLNPRHARHQSKGFLYFEGGARVLSTLWVDGGSRPGHYEFNECVLESRCRVLKSHTVQWDDYEGWFLSWATPERGPVFERLKVFDLTWEYFVRRHQTDLASSFRLEQIHGTIGPSSPGRAVARAELIRSMDSACPAAAGFWRSRAMDIVSFYLYWVGHLAG